ncbi:hypothetical protein [Devosia sp. DBB001]|nr:hypothetical protein [Devosia sp. DBB001]
MMRTDGAQNKVTVDVGGRALMTLSADFIVAIEGQERDPSNGA